MLDSQKLFSIFDETPTQEIIPISSENNFPPSLLIKLFKKIISNHILFSNPIISN